MNGHLNGCFALQDPVAVCTCGLGNDGGRSTPDMVNHPPHYKTPNATFEVIDVIEAFQLPYHLGCVAKYVFRAGKKDPAKLVEDLKKARWYLDRYIQKLEK